MIKKSIRIIVCVLVIILGLALNGCSNPSEPKVNLSVKNYFPKRTMTKHFSGGYENGGFTHTVDMIVKDKVQVKQMDTGTGVILVYQISDSDIRLVFSREVPDGGFKENYIETLEANTDEIILKAPLELGNSWTDNEDGKFEITGVNVQVKTPAGRFDTVEVTFTRGDFEVRRYYASDLGLVKSSIKGYGKDELIKIE